MIRLSDLDLVIYDFDQTLCIHERYNKESDVEHYHANAVAGKNCWDTGKPNNHMKKFIQVCESNGIGQGLMSATFSFKHMEGKGKWVKTNYDVELDNFCVGRSEDKLDMLRAISTARHIPHNRMLFIDDNWGLVKLALSDGFQAATPMEVVNWVDANYSI